MDKPIIIDLEASGFGRNSYPIEIGLAMENGETRCFLLRPESDWTHWDPSSEALHGISRELLLEKGQPIKEVCHSLNDLLDGRTVYSDNWGFDQTWLSLMFEYANVFARFNMESILAILTERQVHNWDNIKDNTLASCGFQRHRASNDALVLQLTYEGILAAGL